MKGDRRFFMMNIIISTLNAKYIHTSLSIRYLKAYAQPDYEVQLAEYTIKDPIMNIVGDLHSKKPDVVGFSCYIWNIEETMKVIAMLKKINPELIIILGGPEVTYDVNDWLDQIPGADFIVMGEGEVTFKSLLSEIEGSQDYKRIGGIAYREDGKKSSSRRTARLISNRFLPPIVWKKTAVIYPSGSPISKPAAAVRSAANFAFPPSKWVSGILTVKRLRKISGT